MDINLLDIVVYVGTPLIVGGATFIVREQLNRITELERNVTNCVTKDELRQAFVDKIEPIREDIAEIRTKLDKLYDFLLKQ